MTQFSPGAPPHKQTHKPPSLRPLCAPTNTPPHKKKLPPSPNPASIPLQHPPHPTPQPPTFLKPSPSHLPQTPALHSPSKQCTDLSIGVVGPLEVRPPDLMQNPPRAVLLRRKSLQLSHRLAGDGGRFQVGVGEEHGTGGRVASGGWRGSAQGGVGVGWGGVGRGVWDGRGR